MTLVENGRLLRANLRRELVTVEEVQSALRQQGIEDMGEVKFARMEGDGRISVIRRDTANDKHPGGEPPAARRTM